MMIRHPDQFPDSNEMSMPAILDEIIRRHTIIMNRDGDPLDVTIFIRKTSQSTGAVKCPDSWDERLMGSSDPNCPTCFGTGYKDGYDKVKVHIRIDSAQRLITLEEMGLVLNYQPMAWVVGDTPLLSNGAIVVRQNNNRFEVMDWTPSSTQGRITRQIFTLKFLPEKEHRILYQLK